MVGNDGTLSVTIDPRQAIAVHTGAKSNKSIYPMAELVPVLFTEKVTTRLGQVSGIFAGKAWLAVSESLWRQATIMLIFAWVEYFRSGQCAAAW